MILYLYMINEVLILPVGSHEYHGEFLPLDTDTIIAERIADAVKNELSTKTSILPCIKFGVSTEHLKQPGTISEPLLRYATKMLKKLEEISQKDTLTVVINGHNGNTKILQAIISEHNYQHKSKVILPPLSGENTVILSKKLLGEHDSHAGSFESSLLAYYELVSDFLIEDKRYQRLVPGSMSMFTSDIINPLGIIKDSAILIANREIGKKIHNQMVEEIVAYIIQQKEIIEVTENGK